MPSDMVHRVSETFFIPRHPPNNRGFGRCKLAEVEAHMVRPISASTWAGPLRPTDSGYPTRWTAASGKRRRSSSWAPRHHTYPFGPKLSLGENIKGVMFRKNNMSKNLIGLQQVDRIEPMGDLLDRCLFPGNSRTRQACYLK